MAEQRLPTPHLKPLEARTRLIRLLQDAHAGEMAAALAYGGHAASVREPWRQEILRIRAEELHHRARLGEMLEALGAAPRPARELKMRMIGHFISAFCRVGGFLIPMYGAGQLERGNIAEYEVAARLALMAGLPGIVDELIEFGEIEWDHEAYFRQATLANWLGKRIPLWPKTEARARIAGDFESFAVEFAKLGGSSRNETQIS
ncbi:MAG: ferritin-like domain-containing protein [Bdellovibrionaceae bacterium]|nr:ferritin-like domain-containing protein [Pseudobdellovibrionaceae bacterium]